MRAFLKASVLVALIGAVLLVAVTRQRARLAIWIGNDALAVGRMDTAVAEYTFAARYGSQSGAAEFNLGLARYAQDRFPEAIERFEQAVVQFRPGSRQSAASFALGNALAKADRLPQALEAYKQSLRINPSDAAAQYNFTLVRAWMLQRHRQTSVTNPTEPELSPEEIDRLLQRLSAAAIEPAPDPGARSGPKAKIDK